MQSHFAFGARSALLVLALGCATDSQTSKVPAVHTGPVPVWQSAVEVPPSQVTAQRADASRTESSNSGGSTAEMESRLTAAVAWLADDARDGRRAGMQGADDAAYWLAAQLEELGLEPAGDSAWFQKFEVPLEARDDGGSHVRLPAGLDQAALQLNAVPLFCAQGGLANGPAVFCGHGLEKEDIAWNDFAGKSVDGAVAVLVRGTPPWPQNAPMPEPATNPHATSSAPADPWGGAGSIFTKVMNAKRRGARAVVLLPQSADEEALAFDAGHGARAGIPAVTLDFADAQKLVERCFGLSAWDGAVKDAAQPAVLDVFADVKRDNGATFNVLARLRGRDTTRCVVVGAHYDHLGRGGTGSLAPAEFGAIHNGADDNASGTAAVLEIARILKSRGTACDVVFALWSGEELGLLGSDHWMQHPTVPLENVRANLNLDMVGRAGSGTLQVLGAGSAAEFARFLETSGPRSGLDLNINTSGGATGGSSDHQSFIRRDIPALHLFSGLHADYHKPTDDADKFEADGTARVVALAADLVDQLAGAPALTFVKPSESETATGRPAASGFKVRLGSIPNYAYAGEGVLIDGASPGTPAERAGLIRGDILMQLGDVKLANVHDLTYALGRYKPGDVVSVRYLRDGATFEARVTLASPSGDIQ